MQTWKHCFQCDFLGQALCSGSASDGNRNAGDRTFGFWAELKEVKTTHLTTSFSQNSILFSRGRNSHQLHCMEFHQNCQGRNYSCPSIKQSLNSTQRKESSVPLFLSVLRRVLKNIDGMTHAHKCFMHQSAPSGSPACTVLPHEKLLRAQCFQMPPGVFRKLREMSEHRVRFSRVLRHLAHISQDLNSQKEP